MLLASLQETGKGRMTVHGHSMEPVIENGATLDYEVAESYEVGDVVFCRVRGRWVDAHWILKKDGDRYLIANNRGWENGWTRRIFARVIR